MSCNLACKFNWYLPVTGAVKMLEAKSPFWSKFSVPKTICVLLEILVWLEDGFTLKAGCSGLVTAPIDDIASPVWALFTKERLLSPW